MTQGFSIGQALAAPFHLVRRQPLAVLVWGLLILLPSVASIAVSFAMMGDIAMLGPDAAPEAVLPRMMQFQAASMLLSLLQIAASLVIATAVIRATLNIGRREAFFFLRLGMDELRYVVVAIATFGGVYIAMIVLMLVGGTGGLALWAIGEPWNWIAAVIIGLACVATLMLAILRVSLIAPATILYRDFAFKQGWVLAKGQVLKLLGLAVLIGLIGIAIWLVIVVVVGGGLSFAGLIDWAGLGEAFQNETWTPALVDWPAVLPWAVASTLPLAFLCGFWAVLGSAPFASATRQLADGAPRISLDAPGAAPADALDTTKTAESPGDTL